MHSYRMLTRRDEDAAEALGTTHNTQTVVGLEDVGSGVDTVDRTFSFNMVTISTVTEAILVTDDS